MARVVIGKVSEIPPGQRKIVVPFRGRAGIGVFNVAGSYYAVRNICPHKQGPLCTGSLSGRVLNSAPPSGQTVPPSIEGDGELLRCPWHQWPFEISTGRCMTNPEVRVKTYPVRIEGEDIVVEYEDEGPLPDPPGLEPSDSEP